MLLRNVWRRNVCYLTLSDTSQHWSPIPGTRASMAHCSVPEGFRVGKIYGWFTSAAAAQTVLYHMGRPYGGGPALHVHTHKHAHLPLLRGWSSHLNLMTLIPLRQPIRALGVCSRPALSTRYQPNMCRGLLPSPINSPRMEGVRDGGMTERD